MSAAQAGPVLSIGAEIELVTVDVSYQGHCVARVDGEVVLVDYAIPGERVLVRIERRKRGLWLGRTLEVLDASDDRVTARCRYYGECGGCQWQHIGHERQLALKKGIVVDQMRRVGRFDQPPVLDVMPSPAPWFYRNQLRMTADADGVLGLARRLSNDHVRVDECVVSDTGINRRLTKLQSSAPAGALTLRAALNTGETLVARRDETQPVFHEEVGGRRFRISAQSFFQVNTHTAELIVLEVRKRLALQPRDRLLDAYAGVGVYSALFGEDVASVVAVEESSSAVADGMHNTLHVRNMRYYQGHVEDVLPRLKGRFDAAVVNPPRAGLRPAAVEWLLAHPAERVVYVSCDPSTLARDLRLLVGGGYQLHDVQPIDQFPQTYHVECVAGLQWSG
jgi:23S rRNA (uracil1939-C5)-methyltransferase